MTTIKISGCEFNITETDGVFSIERIQSASKVKQYKRTFSTIEKAAAYCERMAYLSELYATARQIAQHWNQKLCAWMYKKAKRVVATSKEIFQFNAKLKYMTD